jgi:UDPglucose--hexose-1-phosphate uridylyltransferase
MKDSELRYHATTGEWVLISPKRAKRPNDFGIPKIRKVKISKKSCPFENPQLFGNADPYFWFPQDKPLEKWEVQVLPNKYPALTHKNNNCAKFNKEGIYLVVSGVGYHDLVITRNHYKNFCQLSDSGAYDVLRAFAKRYNQIKSDKCISYISMFQNSGPLAGASVYHPHYQILALPIIPNTINRSFDYSYKYFKKNNRCIHCDIIRKEIKENKRVVYHKNGVLAFVPFASKEPYWVNIFPVKHSSHFEDSSSEVLFNVAVALKQVLKKIFLKLNNPDYNFYIHTSPISEKKSFSHYHWHIEVVPKSNISAGFELSTGVEINPVFPEDAAKLLKVF